MTERSASVVPASPVSPESPANDEPRGRDPRRRCIVTGEIRPKTDLIRFVVDPEGQVVPDVDGKLPGRGLWLYASQDVLHRAQKKHAFSRAARRKVAVSPDLPDEVERLLAARCMEYLGLAKRAGLLVSGLEKVRALITAGKAQVVILAADGARKWCTPYFRLGIRSSASDPIDPRGAQSGSRAGERCQRGLDEGASYRPLPARGQPPGWFQGRGVRRQSCGWLRTRAEKSEQHER